MKIVIDIPDRIYKLVQNKRLNIIDGKILEQALANGTPLPNITGEQISDVLPICAEHQTESLISRYQNDFVNKQ